MKKQLLSLLCALSILFSMVPASMALEGEARRAADTLITLGLLQEQAYELSQPVDRLRACVLLVTLSGSQVNDGQSSPFRDVPQQQAAAVAYALQQGWIEGVSDTAFGAEQHITANGWFTMLLRMLGYRDSAGEFSPSNAAVFARRIGLVSRAYTGTLTLGDVAESALESLRFPYRDSQATVMEHLVERGICTPSAVNALGLNQAELTARQVSDRYMSAVFSIALYEDEEPIEDRESDADASGFFITPDGLALTNYHSIDGARQAVVTLLTGEQFSLERVVWYDVDMDLAVIRVSRTTLDNQEIPMFACLELVGTADLRPGDIAYTLSNPLGLGLAVSSGVISATARTVERYAVPCVMSTADISQGSSGGALLNTFGHVIAVTSGAYRVGNSMYLGVPVDIVPTLDLTVAGNTLAEVAAVEEVRKEAERKELERVLKEQWGLLEESEEPEEAEEPEQSWKP